MSQIPFIPSHFTQCSSSSMAFHNPTQQQYLSQQELHYDYPSPTESDFPYTPSDVDANLYPTPRLTDMYRRDENSSSPWRLPVDSSSTYSTGQTVSFDSAACYPSPGVSQYSNDFPLYAPMPLPKQSSLLFSDPGNFSYPAVRNSPAVDQFYYDGHASELPQRDIPEEHQPSINPDFYSLKPSQSTFPTPSEMLGAIVQTPWFNTDSLHTDEPLPDHRSDTIRSAHHHAMAQSIGFVPTDPCAAIPAPPHPQDSSLIVSPSDSISSHEKKRHYLECLEYYVIYLYQQLHLVGAQPVTLERASTNSRGMSSRSIRTLLVHMANMNRKLNLQISAEEQRFMNLRDAVSAQAASYQEYHRHTEPPHDVYNLQSRL